MIHFSYLWYLVLLFSTQSLIRTSESWPVGKYYTNFLNNNPEEIIAKDRISPGADPEGSFAYAPRAPKSAPFFPSVSKEHILAEKLETLGADRNQVKHVISNMFSNTRGKNIFETGEENKGFFGKLLDKFKSFFSRFL